MTTDLRNPVWASYKEKDTARLIKEVRDRLKRVVSSEPEITVCVVAYNEEKNILNCLNSLSRSVCKTPFEIIVINNNSNDGTQQILDNLEVTSYFQDVQGCGAARELGQQKARGKYILMADADCVYPKDWIRIMYTNLRQAGVAAVFGTHSFLGNKTVPRWKFAIYEIGKDMVLEIRNIKRPYLNAYGMSFGYVREYGLKEGYVMRNVRGEDGRLCFDLMKYGKVKLIRDQDARVWTEERNYTAEGGLRKAILKKIIREVLRFGDYFSGAKPHDTKTSPNSELTYDDYINIVKNWLTGKKNTAYGNKNTTHKDIDPSVDNHRHADTPQPGRDSGNAVRPPAKSGRAPREISGL